MRLLVILLLSLSLSQHRTRFHSLGILVEGFTTTRTISPFASSFSETTTRQRPAQQHHYHHGHLQSPQQVRLLAIPQEDDDNLYDRGNDHDDDDQDDDKNTLVPHQDDHKSTCNNNKRTRTRRQVLFQSAVMAAATTTASTLLLTQQAPAWAAVGETLGSPTTTTMAAAATTTTTTLPPSKYQPAKRPTAYRVDSTIPPTLLPLSNVGKQKTVLDSLARGSGTDKNAIVVDTVNLNNMLNKAVFGTIDKVSTMSGAKKDESKVGPGYASFVCLGLPAMPSISNAEVDVDVELATSLLTSLLQARKTSSSPPTAIGLAFCPYSGQSSLDDYTNGRCTEDELVAALSSQCNIPEDTTRRYLSIVRLVKTFPNVDLLAMSPEIQDLEAIQKGGLQNVNTDRRSQYVADPEGFIALTSDPKYKLYTDRSLLKDFRQASTPPAASSEGNFFAERILTHEAGATAVAKYAVTKPESLVAVIAPTPDLRFMGGINGRIPRVCKRLNSIGTTGNTNKVTEDAVTTILLNPTAQETLSLTRFLRLEIGTGPETLEYQTKLADYIWFSSSPKVNLIPRLMEG